MKRKLFAAAAAAMVILPLTAAMAKQSSDSALNRKLNTFAAIMRELQMNYVDSLPVDSVMEFAIEAALMTIDPYTEYYTPKDRDELSTMTTGEYGGIGSFILERDGNTYISGPFENSPAARAGLRPGDKILRVDTTETKGLRSDKVSAMLKGKPNTKVKIDVFRPYVADSLLTFEVVREKLSTPSVPYYTRLPEGIGYVRLTSFIERSPEEVRAAIDSIRKAGEINSLVLDLRGNGGGLLESAVSILGNFLPKGTEVLRTKGRSAREEKIYKTTRQPLDASLPLVVLVDGGSASASEIVAGALQDLDRAVLVGARSYGKGLVQSTRSLPYEDMLKLTVAKYYIPSGRLIQALDYSHRNPDGTVARTPDSLTNVFHTAAGREVRDGGGLTPDVKIEYPEATRLIYNLVRDNWIFDYANSFAASHPEIGKPEEFAVTDEIFADFKNFINPDKFKYDKACEDILGKLRDAAKIEGYINDEVTAQIDSLGKLLTHDLQSDLDLKRPEIEEYLLAEILSRYYYERGRIQGVLRTDKSLKKAVEILSDPAEYRRLLSAPTASKNADKKQAAKIAAK